MADSKLKTRCSRALLTITLAVAPLSFASNTDIAEVQDMDLVGEARMKVLFWDVYDARLYAPDADWRREPPFALALTYLRELDGNRIAERSIEEMRKQGFDDELTLARWYEMLRDIIPDVSDRDEIVGVADPQGHTRFYLNGDLLGEVSEREFTDRFFGIWLSERTSEPKLRRGLLGGNA